MTNEISLESLQAFLVRNLVAVHHLRFVDVAYILGAFYSVLKVVQITRRRLKTTALRGPPNPSFVWGVGKTLLTSRDSGAVYEKWAEEYGGVYKVPSALGGTRIVLCDPKAIAHLYGGEPWTYILTPFGKIATENFVGKGILSAKGESHRRQRKTLTPGFSNAAIRNLTSVFYDSAYKAKGVWESMIESNGGGSAVIEVQNWYVLDTIGIAGFSHDFGSLDGGKTLNKFLIVLAQALPWLMRLPTPYSNLIKRLNDTMGEVSNALLTKPRQDKEAGTLGEREEKSILGLLVRAENQGSQLHLTREEVMAQRYITNVQGFWLFQWALIELSKNLDIQSKLRAELLEFGADPTYDQLPNNLPYLDAVVHETLRVHAPLSDIARMAAVDDVIPLSKPVRTRSGKLVDHITVAKGTYLSVSVLSMNRSMALWGPDAKEFKPERWIREDGIPATGERGAGTPASADLYRWPKDMSWKGIRDSRNEVWMDELISRASLFVLKQWCPLFLQIVLSILVKNFAFELPDGPETVIEIASGILPRPKVAGEEATAVPLRVRRFE
ncbi:cytochrome P450 [Lanmaoa asiatica]|nr:cytochrome P450 [Lanmaoa asiatica]